MSRGNTVARGVNDSDNKRISIASASITDQNVFYKREAEGADGDDGLKDRPLGDFLSEIKSVHQLSTSSPYKSGEAQLGQVTPGRDSLVNSIEQLPRGRQRRGT